MKRRTPRDSRRAAASEGGGRATAARPADRDAGRSLWRRPPSGGVLFVAGVVALTLSAIDLALLRRPDGMLTGLVRLATAYGPGGWAMGHSDELRREPVSADPNSVQAHQMIAAAAEQYARGLQDAASAAPAAAPAAGYDAANGLTRWYAAWLAYEADATRTVDPLGAWGHMSASLDAAPPPQRYTTYERELTERNVAVLARYTERRDTPRIIVQDASVSGPSIILPSLVTRMESLAAQLAEQGHAAEAQGCRQRVSAMLRAVIHDEPSAGTVLLCSDLLGRVASGGETSMASSRPQEWRDVAERAARFGSDLLARIDDDRTNLFISHVNLGGAECRTAIILLAGSLASLLTGLVMATAGALTAASALMRRSWHGATHRERGSGEHALPEPSLAGVLRRTAAVAVGGPLILTAGIAWNITTRAPAYRLWHWVVLPISALGIAVATWAAARLIDRAAQGIGPRRRGLWPAAAAVVLLAYAGLSPAWTSRAERILHDAWNANPRLLTGAGVAAGLALALGGGWLRRRRSRRPATMGSPRARLALGVLGWACAAALSLATWAAHGAADRSYLDALVARSERIAAIIGDDWYDRYFKP